MILFGLEGPFKGETINLDDNELWLFGRDENQCNFVIDDSSVSRKHLKIIKTDDGYLLNNLSETNPSEVNDEVIDQYVLKEGDKIKIGNSLFLFTESENEEVKEDNKEEIEEIEEPPKEEKDETIYEEPIEDVPYSLIDESPFILKVISGPNAGAEFGMGKNRKYIIGKDPNISDIIFTDLSVSRKNSEISVDEEGNIYLEDLSSKNGTFLNGTQIKEKAKVEFQDVITIGTTSFVIVSKEESFETIYSPPTFEKEEKAEEKQEKKIEEKELSWKKQFIPKSHLTVAGVAIVVIFVLFLSFFALFKSHNVEVVKKEPVKEIENIVQRYNDIQYSFNQAGGNLFLVGHVLTAIDKKELFYELNQLGWIEKIDDNVIIDESIKKNFNDTLFDMEEFRSVYIHTPKAGEFILEGMVQFPQNFEALQEWVNNNFPYLDKLKNEVVINQILQAQVASIITKYNMFGINFEVISNELVLAGRYDENKLTEFNEFLKELKKTKGINSIKNLAVVSTESSARIDISDKYKITGYSSYDGVNFSVIVNGKIITLGDLIDGLKITKISQDTILLEKDDIKYTISYSR